MNSHIFFSQCYGRVKTRNSFTIMYNGNSFGQVQYYLCIEKFTFAIVHRFEVTELCAIHFSLPFSNLDHVILPVHVPSSPYVDLVNVNDINEKCIYVPTSPTQYIIRFCKVSIGE